MLLGARGSPHVFCRSLQVHDSFHPYYPRDVARVLSKGGVPSNDIPQANSLDRIRRVLLVVARGATSTAAIGEQAALSPRHVAYHVQAARILGWLADLPDGPQVTARGEAILQTQPESEAESKLFAESVIRSPPLRKLGVDLLGKAPPSVEKIASRIARATGLAETTAERRALALLAWRQRILRVHPLTLFSPEVVAAPTTNTPPNESDSPLKRAERRNVLKSVTYRNWKSFEGATLHIDPLTVVIGTNAGGKSNALDGLEFLHRLSTGEELSVALSGGPQVPPIRGGIEWAAREGSDLFTIEVLVQGTEERTDYEYSITVQTQPRLQLHAEKLTRVKYRPRTTENPARLQLFWTDDTADDEPSITARFYNKRAGTRRAMRRNTAILAQALGPGGSGPGKEISEAVEAVTRCLRNVFVLDPVPSTMRDYSPFSDVLASDGSNVAGVLAALPRDRRANVEEVLTLYLRRLPDRDIKKVKAEPVGKFKRDAMLYCYEQWVPSRQQTIVDARGMSDGTLRFVAILTALLTRPAGSLLVIEEVDTGLHASRAALLLEMLRTVGQQNGVDVLVTTHNQAMIDALGAEMVPFVVVAHRNANSGYTELTLLEDIVRLPKLLASGPLGTLVARGLIEQSLDADE